MANIIVPKFVPEDVEADQLALGCAPVVFLQTIQTEFYVLKSFFIHLVIYCRNILTLPLVLLFRRDKSLEYKYLLADFVSLVITFLFFFITGISIQTGVNYLKAQKFYKLWAIYTILFVCNKVLTRINKFTHRMLRGAVRTGKNYVLAILMRSISINLYVWYFIGNAGSYLAGIYGKEGLFFSVCLHIQCIIVKKTLPKILDISPIPNESISRMIILLGVFHHLATGEFHAVRLMVLFELGCGLARFFLTYLTDDGQPLIDFIKTAQKNTVDQFVSNNAPPEKSVFTQIPHEAASICLLILVFQGSIFYKIAILGFIAFFALAGEFIIAGRVLLLAKVEEKKPEETKKDEKKDGKNEDKKPKVE